MRLTAPSFWWRERAGAGVLLWPFARLWGIGAEWRMARPARFRPPVAVICVGNYVVGGAGKTPTVIALVRLAKAGGLKPGILARGYGGNTAGPVLVDRAAHRAAEVGDEALLLAVAAPTVVASDRVAGAKRLLEEGVDMIILDDGFQDPALAKDVALIAIDAAAGVGNGRVMPAGPLRAPLRAQVRATDALLVIGEGSRAQPLIRLAARAGRPVFTASLIPATTREWQKDKILAFAGIGRPQKFFDSLAGVRRTAYARQELSRPSPLYRGRRQSSANRGGSRGVPPGDDREGRGPPPRHDRHAGRTARPRGGICREARVRPSGGSRRLDRGRRAPDARRLSADWLAARS